ncbi:hypothetical protein [Streptomyces sp. NPDC058755]|uniref:hypothetical protein n=1 Tax=Streptomyces sp. NPDC058755 TaxID=3346624 RepID=UPI0036BD453A
MTTDQTADPAGDVFDAPDHADEGWQHTDLVDFRPGPIGAVAVAVTHERLSEQCAVTLYLDPESAEHGYRVRAAYTDCDESGDGEAQHADLGSVEILRISGYGTWAQQGLAATLRTAADLGCR